MKASGGRNVDWRRLACILLGLGLFALVYYAPTPNPAVDPQGEIFPLSREGKAALALFLLAATWWVTEVVPIGVTSIAIAVIQALFFIRQADTDAVDALLGKRRGVSIKPLELRSFAGEICFMIPALPLAQSTPRLTGCSGVPWMKRIWPFSSVTR